MPELVFELGCEELPASFVRKACADLERAITSRLQEAGIPFGESRAIGTPRRLIVQVKEVDGRQPDSRKKVRGPAVSAAYDANGSPTKALEGFCRGQGVDPAKVEREGEHVWVTQFVPGKPTADVLSSVLPDSVRSLTFEKAMRWGELRMRFARPIRWMLAAFEEKAVQFEIDGVIAGLESRGHRFNGRGTFEATSFDQLVSELRSRQVEPDPEIREGKIREQALAVTSGKPDLADALVEENTFLTEWPTAVEGTFREDYLELPSSVLVTAMAKHEKFFPVRDDNGRLTNRFVSIRNGGVDKVVAEGNAWVLNARFNDAKFFYDEDAGHSMADFLEKTKGIIFQDKLGTVHQRANRLTELCEAVALATGADEPEVGFAKQAGLYSKADLSTGLVSELPTLQGKIGAEYGRKESFPSAVCWAIASQYDFTLNLTVDGEDSRTALRLIVADQMDKLAGYLGVGHIPSGSSDPFGLRRAAALLIEIALRWPGPFPDYAPLFARAGECYQSQGFELSDATSAVRELFRSRYDSVFGAVRFDLVEAALLDDYLNQSEELQPQRVRFRLEVLKALAEDIAFVQTATRPQNILTAAVNKGVGFTFLNPLENLDLKGMDSKEGEALASIVTEISPKVRAAVTQSDPHGVAAAAKSLAEPINEFFDKTMVMADDVKVRSARLTLLHATNLVLREAGDFSKIVIS
jgi:glycyl-tRNA synthetase beta chain